MIRQPYLGYEQPAPNTDALRTVDDFELFNGATDRFDWTLPATLYVYHDLKQRRYVVDGIDNGHPSYRFLTHADPREFSHNSLLYYVR